MADMRWFDPNAINEYYQQGIRGMRTGLDDILNYVKGNDFTQSAINKGREAYNTFFGNQNAEAKAQQGRFQAKGGKETVGPRKVKMSQIQGNIANKGIDPNNLKVPIDPTKEVNINVNPQTVAKAPKTGFFGSVGKLAGKATPWLAGGLGAWGTISNWNKPGSDNVSRFDDIAGTISAVGGPWAGGVLGAKLGSAGGPWGTAIGTLAGVGAGLYNAHLGELRRRGEAPYETSYLKNPDFIRQTIEDNLRREAKNLGMSEEEANAWVAEYLKNDLEAYRYAQQYGSKKPLTEMPNGVEEQGDSQSPYMDRNDYLIGTSVGSLPELPSVDATGAPGTSVEGSVGNSNPMDNLATLLAIVNGLGNNIPNFNVLSPADMMGLLSQNGYNPYGYGVQQQQQPTDDNGFIQRVYDKANDIRSIEGIEQDAQNRPELRPKAEIEQPKTSDDIMLEKLNKLNDLIGGTPQYKDYDPIQRMWIARAGGMTPYQVWGDYPNQNTRLKNIYDAMSKEYEIRKDIEDRDRIKKAGEALSQKFVDDPMLQYAVASGADLKDIADMMGIPEANKFPYEMAKENIKAQNTLMNTAMTGNNTAYNTLIGKQFDLSTLPFTTQMDILKNYPQYLNPSANTVFEEAGKETRDVRDKATQIAKANQNAMVRMAIAEMKQEGKDTKLGDLAKMLELLTNTGSLTPEQALAVAGTYIDLGALQKKNKIGSGVSGLFR